MRAIGDRTAENHIKIPNSRLAFLFLLLILLLDFPGLVHAQFPFAGDERKPQGRIRSFTESLYETSSGQPVLVQKSRFRYGPEGKLTEQHIYQTIDTSAIDYSVTYLYSNGRLDEVKADGIYRLKFMYDRAGNKIACKYSSDTLRYLDRFIYNEQGALIERLRYDEDGNLRLQERFVNDQQKRCIGSDLTDLLDAGKSRRFAYTLDDKGNKMQQRTYASSGYMLSSTNYSYDQRGNLLEERSYSESGIFLWRNRYKYHFDGNGNWTGFQMTIKGGSFADYRAIEYMQP